jgi:rhomboid protease GluP
MTSNIPPNFKIDLPIGDLTLEQFYAITRRTIERLDWKIENVDQDCITATTRLSHFSEGEKILITVGKDIAHLESTCKEYREEQGDLNERNLRDFVSTFNSVKSSEIESEESREYSELNRDLVQEKTEASEQVQKTFPDKIKSFLSIFKPVRGFFITPILVDLNITIFLLMVISGSNLLLPSNADLVLWGANFGPLTLSGQGWRLLTCCFIHIGIVHLLMNMYGLCFIGILLEPRIGRGRILAAYLLSGFVASLTSIAWQSTRISAGASGAIFGLYGVFLSMLTTNLIERKARNALLMNTILFIAYNLMYGMKAGIDNAAHMGGLVSGIVIGYAFYPGILKPNNRTLKYIPMAGLTILTLSASFIIWDRIPNELGKYDNGMERFAFMESEALKLFDLPKDTPKDTLLFYAKERGIKNWNEAITLLENLDKMNLPPQLHNRIDKLTTYCQLRTSCYYLIYKSIDENTSWYDEQISDYNKQINDVLAEIRKSDSVQNQQR